jgi:hypothetical protein
LCEAGVFGANGAVSISRDNRAEPFSVELSIGRRLLGLDKGVAALTINVARAALTTH